MDIGELLAFGVKNGASDLHLSAGLPPMIRVAAIEVLINTPHIADLILKGELHELKEAMEGSGSRGMQTFDMALHSLFKEERISLEEALSNADSRTNLEAKINFG